MVYTFFPYKKNIEKQKTDFIHVSGNSFPVKIIIETRKTVTASMRQQLIIRIPRFLTQTEKQKQVDKMKEWLCLQLHSNESIYNRYTSKTYKDGDSILIRGTRYFITTKIKKIKQVSIKLSNDKIQINTPSDIEKHLLNLQVSQVLSRKLGHKYLPVLENKIDYYNDNFFNETINHISFKNSISTWGSCSNKKNLNISTRLLLAPDDVLNYVCIHELAHLKQLNHSKHFWDLVKHVMPNYKTHTKWLKQYGDSCRF